MFFPEDHRLSVARSYPPFATHPSPFPIDGRYRAECYYVVDGDTIDVLIDLGFGEQATERLRLKDFDAPETAIAETPAERAHGLKCKARVEELLLEKSALLKVYKTTGQERQTLGRYVADIWYWTGTEWKSLRRTLVDEHLSKGDVPRA